MDLSEMRQWMRDAMEVEAEDWPDAQLDHALREGYERIIARSARWPFMESAWSLAVAPGVPSLEMTDDMGQILTLDWGEDHRRMSFVDHMGARQGYGTRSGIPQAWSVWGRTIHLWPTPNVGGMVHGTGFRRPAPFVSESGWVPDLPPEFHPLMMDWAMANEYQRQDDPEMMATYRNKFEEQLTSIRGQYAVTPPAPPLVVGGAAPTGRPSWMRL